MEQMKENASEIASYLLDEGWTINAISGMLGNMQTESTINPGIWQDLNEGNMSGGYGLVQWTPATKYIDWAIDRGLEYSLLTSNLQRILYEVEKNAQWGDSATGEPPPYTFYEFTRSTDTPYNLGLLFLKHYERPYDANQPVRGTQAEYWFEYLTGNPPDPPDPPTPTKRKLPLYMMVRLF